jgi:hypothetical protein
VAGLAATAAILVLIALMTYTVRRGWIERESRAATAALLVVAVPAMASMAVLAGAAGAWSGVAVAAFALIGLAISVLPVAEDEASAEPRVVVAEATSEPVERVEERRAA